jgi:DNA polymerase-3 subunit delta'
MWTNIIGQNQVIETLKTLYQSGRVSHAYLFYGQEGTGKDAAAIEFAKLLNCANRINNEACDNCSNCKNISSLRSDYFHFITALPSGRSEPNRTASLESLSASDYESYLEQLKLKCSDPYHRFRLPGANNIRIDSIRELINQIYLSAPVNGETFTKVFLISPAEKMRQEASNALLKVLEEPPKNAVIILTTSKPEMLPPTVAGRCQKIHFPPLSTDEIQEHLDGSEYAKEEIHLAASFSQGSLSRAKELLESGVKESREAMLSFLIAVLRPDYAEVVRICRDESSHKDKDRIKFFLMLLSVWFRDLLWMKEAGASDNIVNKDIEARLERFITNYPNLDFYNIISSIEEAEKMIFENVQAQLVLIDLAFKLRECMGIDSL